MSTRDTSEIDDTTEITQTEVAFEDHSSFETAYEKRLTEIQAVSDESLAALNVDVFSAVTTVLGCLPAIAKYREAMSTLADLDEAKVQGLEEYARATAQAQSRWVNAISPPAEILELNTQAMAMRETFRLNAVTLAHHGLIAPETVATFKGLVGYKNVGFDLVRLADLMRDSWSNIQGKTALTKQEVQNAKDLGERLVEAAGLREHSPAVQAEAAHVRQQALTLLLAAYDETRRAIGYLRWHKNDADTIAPSLYAGKTRQSTAATAPADQPEPSPNPTTPEPPAQPPAANTPATPAHAGTNGANGATTGLAAVAQGLPGASPFGA